MMKKVSLSQLLSRSPRHGSNSSGCRRASSGANGEVLLGSSSPVPSNTTTTTSSNSSPTHDTTISTNTQDKTSKKKNKCGILQTLKKKISGKFDTLQNANVNTPKKSKSFEGLSNSFGDSFSQSISEESSSDGLNASGGQAHKSKHNKRAIRPMHTPITRQNSSSHVLTDSEDVLTKVNHGEGIRVSGVRISEPSTAQQTPPVAAVSLFSKNNYISETTGPSLVISETLVQPKLPEQENKNVIGQVPQVLVENVSGRVSSAYGAMVEPNKHFPPSEHSAISETSSPQPGSRTYSELWNLQEVNFDASKRSLAEELFRLAKFGWYWGPITRAEAEEKLVDQPDGAFLVRDSSDDKYLLSLSFRSFNKTLHTRIEHSNGWFSFYPHPEHEGHTSLVGLIDHCMSHSESGVFCYSRARVPGSPSFPVRLTKPVSRFTQVRSLQYLCRFVIRQYTRVDHIQALPLPTRIKGYLEEGHY